MLGMSKSSIKVIGHLSFVFVLILLVGAFVVAGKKTGAMEKFDEKKTRYSVLFFYQEGCGHCHELLNPSGPLAMLANTTYAFLNGDGKNCKVDVDFSKAVSTGDKGAGPIDVNLPENKALAAKHAVSHTPFVVLVDSTGKQISEFSGPQTCQGMAKWLNTNIPCIPQTVC